MLSGTVNDRWAKRHAEDLIESISGVQNVENRIRVKQQDENDESEDSDTSSRSARSSSITNGSTANANSSADRKTVKNA